MKHKDTNPDMNNILTENSHFSVVEAYKVLRANINFAIPKTDCKKIMICSSYSREGKTTTCVNLAITIAQTGAEVLLIDCDLRRSRLHELLNLSNDTGISNYLSNQADIQDIIKDTHIPSLHVITAGDISPNPAELLSSSKMVSLFEEFQGIIDYLIIDTPPICVVADALPLLKICDGVILVVRHLVTSHNNIKEALEKLNFAGANVIGMILNGIEIKRSSKKYGKYGGYPYNYYNYSDTSEKNNIKDD